MKTIVILFAISFVAVLGHPELTDEDIAKHKEHHESCMNENGLNESTVVNKWKDDNDEKLNCYKTCLLKKSGTMNADGKIDVEVARANLEKKDIASEKIEEMINACKDVTGTGCEMGRDVFKCFMQFYPQE
ncbi:PREDICTED: general odorant-binding protein 56h-like [Cyphomyrmex costatus]|uniref:Pheromone-binding protein-related protein 2 n=1 Tax=Cyphomyrmex costatus TaxID=456900 RepID=A0A151K2A2_9HYME|nr:PREDICTED: general odorant-binding protein 56h-like [Cyphomyrmex costatus]KYN50255.1 hypothetical protein ALC62_06892 [Cyphomyrmex costatus]